MKKYRKYLLFLLCLLMVQVFAAPDTGVTKTVQAATVKSGLKKEKGKYYYYKNGAKLINKWKTVKTTKNGKTVSYKYYFGKNGAAYAAPVPPDNSKYAIVVKKINNKKYGFDRYGHMVKGDYVNSKGKFYSFSAKNGVLDSSRTSALNKAAKLHKSSAALRKLLGKPKKTKNMGKSCMKDGATDYALLYAHFEVDTYKLNGKEYMAYVWPR